MGGELRSANRKRHRIIIKRRLLSENLVLRQTSEADRKL